MKNNDNIYYEYLSLIKKYLYYKIKYNLFKKFPFLFTENNKISVLDSTSAKAKYVEFERRNKTILDRYYVCRIKKHLSNFEFELLNLLFFNIEDLKFNALVKKIKDPDKIPLSDDDYYEINLNEALELIILDEKEKFIMRKKFLTYSYLLEHKIICFLYSESVTDNPFIYNENIKLNVHIINKLMDINSQPTEVKHSNAYFNRLRIGEDGF